MEGDGDVMTGGVGAMNGGGHGLRRGGKVNFGWCVNGKGGKCGGHSEARGVP